MKDHLVRNIVFTVSTILLGCASTYPADTNAQSYREYYPQYRPHHRNHNPVVRRDYYNNEGYAPNGTYHSEDTVEDRRKSYYSPGRNTAITRPKTTVDSWSEAPGQKTTREETKWIGADGKPHSTTIQRDTQTDRDGNTHTDTHVTLKRANKNKGSDTEK